jgi:hypothetical protein
MPLSTTINTTQKDTDKLLFIYVVIENMCGTTVFNGPIVHRRMIDNLGEIIIGRVMLEGKRVPVLHCPLQSCQRTPAYAFRSRGITI